MEILGYIFSLLIGVSVGLIGSGGSILAVPILVYLFGVTPEVATTHSLFIVGITSVIAAYRHYRLGFLKLKEALTFAIPSVIILLLTRKFILPAIPGIIIQQGSFVLTKQKLIMMVFSTLMIIAAYSMIQNKSVPDTGASSPSRLVFIGLLIGLITGLLGAGGGFLIVPALLFYGRLSLRHAIATSIFIVTTNSLIGFTGDLINGVYFDKMLLLKISSIAIAGMFVGIAISKRIDGKKLKPLFGWFVLAMGVFIITKELFHF